MLLPIPIVLIEYILSQLKTLRFWPHLASVEAATLSFVVNRVGFNFFGNALRCSPGMGVKSFRRLWQRSAAAFFLIMNALNRVK